MTSTAKSRKDLVRKHLFRLVQTGHVGDKLPAERQLCELLNVARGTVRAATQELIDDGYISTIKGSGMFIQKTSELAGGERIIGIACGHGGYAYYGYYMGKITLGSIGEICDHGHQYVNLEKLGESTVWAQEITQLGLHGVLWINPMAENIRILGEAGVPVVALGTFLNDYATSIEASSAPTSANGVFVDQFQEGFVFVNHCVNRGHRKFMIIDPRPWGKVDCQPFFKGIEAALNENGLDLKKDVKHFTQEFDENKVADALRQGFTGIYCNHKKVAHVHKIMRGLGFVHGKNCCLVARNSFVKKRNYDVQCDKVDVRLEEIGKQGAELLIDIIENGEREPVHRYVKPVVKSES